IRNNRIGANGFLNQRCALTPDLESILRTQTGKILLQQNRHEAADRGSATSRQILRVEQTCHGRRGTAESGPESELSGRSLNHPVRAGEEHRQHVEVECPRAARRVLAVNRGDGSSPWPPPHFCSVALVDFSMAPICKRDK